jgi:hypothetical protein
MSFKGIQEEVRENFNYRQLVFILVLLLILIFVISLHYWRKSHRNYIHQKNASTSLQNEETLTRLLQLQNEVKNVEADLNNRLQSPESLTSPSPNSRGSRPHAIFGAGLPAIGIQPGQGFSPIKTEKEEIYIPSGSVFKAQLLMPIKTSIQESFVMAQTTHEFRMDNIRRVPRGTRLIGSARLNPVLKGVAVHFNLLVSPRGIEYPISLLALSPDLFPELSGIYFTNELETYSTIMAFGFLSGFSEAAQQREPSLWGPVAKPNLTNQVLNGVSTASFRVAENLLEDVRRRAVEYVIIPAGERIYIVFDRKFVLQGGIE